MSKTATASAGQWPRRAPGSGVRRAVPVRHPSDATAVSFAASAFARSVGCCERVQGVVALVAAELASSIARHAGQGTVEFLLRVSDTVSDVVIRAKSQGSFVGDPREAIADGYSRGTMRPLGMAPDKAGGLGVGLGAVKRLSDELHIEQTPDGSIIVEAACHVS